MIPVFKEEKVVLKDLDNKLLGTKILVVDDEAEVLENISDYLTIFGAEVFTIQTETDIKSAISKINPNIIILDYNLSGFRLDGISILKEIKQDAKTAKIPVIMMSGMAKKQDEYEAVLSGASDFLWKPFVCTDLLVKSVIQLNNLSNRKKEFVYKNIRVCLTEKRVYFKDVLTDILPIQALILAIVLERPEEIISKEYIVKSLNNQMRIRTLDVHILMIRKALEKVGIQSPILTLRNVGYKINF